MTKDWRFFDKDGIGIPKWPVLTSIERPKHFSSGSAVIFLPKRFGYRQTEKHSLVFRKMLYGRTYKATNLKTCFFSIRDETFANKNRNSTGLPTRE